MSLSILCWPEELRSLAAGSIGAAYVDLGDALANPSILLHIQNNTNADILISFAKGTDHEFIAAGGFLLLDVNANKSNTSSSRSFPQGTQFQVKQGPDGAPSSGNVYLSTYYALTRS